MCLGNHASSVGDPPRSVVRHAGAKAGRVVFQMNAFIPQSAGEGRDNRIHTGDDYYWVT